MPRNKLTLKIPISTFNYNLRELLVPHVTYGNITALVLPRLKEWPLRTTLQACPITEVFKGLPILRRLSSAKTATNLTRIIQPWPMASRSRIPIVNGKTAYGDREESPARIVICPVDDISGKVFMTQNGSKGEFA